MKVLNTDARLLVRQYCICCEPQSVNFVARGRVFRRNVRAVFIASLPLAVARQSKLKAQATLQIDGVGQRIIEVKGLARVNHRALLGTVKFVHLKGGESSGFA